MAREPYIDLKALMADAEKIAGCDDWGDEEFREPLERLVAAINAEAELTPLGVERTRSHLRKLMVARLKLFGDRRIYPGIPAEQVSAPLVLTGLARSGTSYLYGLLGADPRNYSPLHWQIWTLSPPPALPSTDNRPQEEAGEQFIHSEGWDDPDIRAKHDYSAKGQAEDALIHELAFTSKALGTWWNVPSYVAWVADLAPAYRIERKVLQALQYGGDRERWVVKSPLHVAQLPYLLGEFPDARVVMNHRDPVKALASVVSLVQAHRRQFGNVPTQVDRDFALGVVESSATRVASMMQTRKDPAINKQFVDVSYLDLEREPLGQVAKVYEHHGIEFTGAARTAMQRYIDENRKGKHGAHKYDIRDMGVRVEEVRERFKGYIEHFDIPLEG
jgi:hypothetical protein